MKTRVLWIAAALISATLFGVQCRSANAGGPLLAKHQCGDECGGKHCKHCGHFGWRHCHEACCGNKRALQHSGEEWAGNYYHTMWGQPVALIVPPTAELQTHWNWGVAQTAVTPIWPQYTREFPGPYAGGRGFLPTPRWPSSTDQFGVYYVRGPW